MVRETSRGSEAVRHIQPKVGLNGMGCDGIKLGSKLYGPWQAGQTNLRIRTGQWGEATFLLALGGEVESMYHNQAW